ncbi:RNA exonuclease Rex2 [Trichophaea hybrida]|nr:RNA exonuclease Rex2 [Trichophaea hybrida]
MLHPSTAPLVWIDCEMTGLKRSDVLLQIACYITSSNLTLLEPSGLNLIISRPPSILDAMDSWCTTTHSATGLTSAVLASTLSVEVAGKQLLQYIQTHVPEKGVALLAGNTVHADKAFLEREMPEVVEWLHYRILDVSAIKEAARRWCGDEVLRGVPKKRGCHEAREDIKESIEEAKYWRDTLFVPAKSGVDRG